MRRRFSPYWPFLALPLVAGLLHWLLVAIGEPWSYRDWASNVIFAIAVAAATVMLSRNQSRLQQSTAQAKLVEKIGAITGALDDAWTNGQASTVQQILIDARAGLNLLPYADRESRREYIETLAAASERLRRIVHDWARPYTLWEDSDWPLIHQLATSLTAMLNRQVRRPQERNSPAFISLLDRLGELGKITGPQREIVPFTAFELSFRHPVEGDHFAPELDWDLLRHYVATGESKITVTRSWSHEWLADLTAFSIWYSRRNGSKSASYTDSDAEPIPHNEIDRFHKVLDKGTKSTIESLAWQFEVRQDGRLPTIEIVTFRLGDKSVIVLDGNHRLASIYYDKGNRPVPARIVEYRIEAPLDATLLPDLICHDIGGYREADQEVRLR
jgi:hypothetical protein